MNVIVKATPRSVIDKARPVAAAGVRIAARAPVQATAASGRGLARTAKGVRAWVLCEKRMASAVAADKYYAEADKIRAHQHARIKGSLIGLALLLAGLVAFWYLTEPWVKALVILAIWSLLILKGRAQPDLLKPRRKPGLLGLTQEQLNTAFLAAGVIKKDHSIGVVQPPHTDGRGVALTVDLPPGITAASAIATRERLASALVLNENGLVLQQVSGETGHAGRLSMWATPGDPFAAGSGRHPLLGEQRWNAWRGAAFGVDARGREVLLRLIGSHMLIGAAPNAGKSYAGRCAAAPFVLDPGTRIYIADGKGSDTWAAAEQTAAAYVSGDEDEHALLLSRMLDGIITEVRYRNAHKITGSKLTETRSRDADDPIPLLLVIIDEMQEYTGNTSPDPDSDERKPPTLGRTIATKLMKLGKLARSAGVVLLLLTQRPDDDALPKGLRAVLLTRFALRTRDRWNSDMILGPDFAARGYSTASDNGHELRKGVGILVPDNGEDPDAPEGYPTLRTFELDDDDWTALCRRGSALRRDQDTGEGWNPGGGGDGPVDLTKPPQPDSRPAQALPDNVIRLRDYLLDSPTSKAHGTERLSKVLGTDPEAVREIFRKVGLTPTQVWIHDEHGKRQLRGYKTINMLAAIRRMECDSDSDAA